MADSRSEAVKKLAEMVEAIDFCMLTTIDGGYLRSRPMSTQKFEFDGDLWFFTSDQTHKVDEIEKDGRVNVAYSDPGNNRYVSVAGRGSLSRDRSKIEELWSPILKAWFPDGIDDPHLALLKVEVDEAEYWDSPSSKLVQIVGFVKALATGKAMDGGENEKIQL